MFDLPPGVLIDSQDAVKVKAFKWRIHNSNGCVYAARSSANPIVFLHHFILGTSDTIDHKDGNGLNNCRSNLRLATLSQNQMNRRKRNPKHSRFKGVYKDRTSYRADITVNRRTIHLGNFKNEVDAAMAYDRAARERNPEFACLNFPFIGEQGALPT